MTKECSQLPSQKLRIADHLLELKARLLKIVVVFTVVFALCYYFSDYIYDFLLRPLADSYKNKSGNSHGSHKVIYTGLAEAFFTYIKLASFSSLMVIIPFIACQIYLFVSPALYKSEKLIAIFIFFMSPILFWCGSIFVFYYVMPKAWQFFLSFEQNDSLLPMVLEARISEYLTLVIQLMIAFGLAFQLPIILLVLNLLGLLSVAQLKQKRRIAIVVNFVIAGILTPPDVISQFALAIPLLLLYETSIIMCKFIENRKNHYA